MDNAAFAPDDEDGQKVDKNRKNLTKNVEKMIEMGVQNTARNNPFDEKGQMWPQVVAAIGANMGAFAFGCVLSWSATAVPSLKIDTDFQKITELHSSWIHSIVMLGALAACPPAGALVDKIGRRKTMLLTSIPFLAAWLIQFFAQNVAMILIGRFVTGMCSGAYTIAAPIFVAETSQPAIRGMLVSGYDTMACVGVMFQLIIGTYVSWRWQALAGASVPVAIFAILVFVPESPRYLLSRGLDIQASKSLCWFRGVSKDSQLIVTEIKELNDSIEKSRETEGGSNRWQELWKPTIRKSMFVGFGLFALQVFSGMTTITFYRVEIFQSSHVGLDEYMSSIIVAFVDLLSSLCAASVVDRLGRKFLMISSELLMALALGGLGAFFHLKKMEPDFAQDTLSWLPLTSLVLFVGGYSVGIGAIPFTVVPEILPQRVRGLGSSLLTSSRYVLAFLVSRFFRDLMNSLGEDGGYWFFASCCLFGAFFVFFFVPETTGKSLEVIQEDLKT